MKKVNVNSIQNIKEVVTKKLLYPINLENGDWVYIVRPIENEVYIYGQLFGQRVPMPEDEVKFVYLFEDEDLTPAELLKDLNFYCDYGISTSDLPTHKVLFNEKEFGDTEVEFYGTKQSCLDYIEKEISNMAKSDMKLKLFSTLESAKNYSRSYFSIKEVDFV